MQQGAVRQLASTDFSKNPGRVTWYTAEITSVEKFLALYETLIFPG
jgi:hypothetical protein